jgi:hypothetical protein
MGARIAVSRPKVLCISNLKNSLRVQSTGRACSERTDSSLLGNDLPLLGIFADRSPDRGVAPVLRSRQERPEPR